MKNKSYGKYLYIAIPLTGHRARSHRPLNTLLTRRRNATLYREAVAEDCGASQAKGRAKPTRV